MAHYPQKLFVSLDMYNQLAPFFGHDPIPMAPMFPTTDMFLTNYKQTNDMTEQGLIEYAKKGDQAAIAHLGAGGFEGVDWRFAITHVNGGWLPGEDIKRVWIEMVKIHEESKLSMEEINNQLQAALDVHHTPLKLADVGMSPAGRPWDFNFKHKLKFGRGTNQTPPKKKRK